MRKLVLFSAIAISACVLLLAAQQGAFRSITLDALNDKIAGGWAGQMIGVSFGAPTEFKAQGKINDSVLPKWTVDRVSNSIGQDDLYVDMTFAQVLDEKGLDATTEDFGAMFRNSKYQLWHANLAARRLLNRGVPPSESGNPRYNTHAEDIDFQIESDFIGLMAPGLYQASNDLAWRAGRVMNYGDGIYGGMFVSGMYAAAFFESDPRHIVEQGLKCIPAKSPYGMLIADILAWSKQYPDDWRKVWQLLEDKWDKNDVCPDGALRAFNIDAKLNGGYIALGVLYGKGDFGKTIDIATRAGQDSDCNPASAAGIMGVVLGYNRIPDEWKGGIPALAGQKFQFTNHSFETIVDSTRKRAIALIERNGGRVEGKQVFVKVQTPKEAKLETWTFGHPVERIAAKDTRWTWSGNWQSDSKRRTISFPLPETKVASDKDASATVTFSGTGAIVVGPYLPNGGKANVYLDGKLSRTVDVNSDDPKSSKGAEDVWHAWGLKNGLHTVKVVVRGEPYGGQPGTAVAIDDLVVYR